MWNDVNNFNMGNIFIKLFFCGFMYFLGNDYFVKFWVFYVGDLFKLFVYIVR